MNDVPRGVHDPVHGASAKMNVTVLLSGGIDSAACVAFYMASGHRVSALHVDYGQLARHDERQAALAIAVQMRVPLKILSIHDCIPKRDGQIRGRNCFLISLAVMEAESEAQLLALGVHSGTPYYDCSSAFMQMMNALVVSQTDGMVQVGAPFLAGTKRQIWVFAANCDVPLSLTYSCERGGKVTCGACPSCKALRQIRAG